MIRTSTSTISSAPRKERSPSGRQRAAGSRSGLLVSIDGVEGAGKSTQCARLADVMRREGWEVVVTREPGGTELGRSLRRMLLDASTGGPTPATELLLYLADRAEHVRRIIRPAIERGALVIVDRFSDSTVAYQAHGRELPEATVRSLDEFARDGVQPTLTFLHDLPVQAGLERARARGVGDRLERESTAFHERVRAGFLAIARAEPGRVQVLDATLAVDELTRAMADELRSRVGSVP